jgi:hypothetical protein
MQDLKTIARGSASQTFAAIGILVVLGHVIPVLGLVLLPAVALSTWARAVGESLPQG